MKILYEDGGKLECNEITIAGDKVYADGIYEILIADVNKIVGE